MYGLVDAVRNMPCRQDREVAACAERILHGCGANAAEGEVPIVSILREMGINTYLNDMPFPAYIAVSPEFKERFGTTKIACVKDSIPYVKKRSALAHELAHYLFDYDEAARPEYCHIYAPDRDRPVWEDHRADVFAGNLLMPQAAFRAEYKKLWRETGSLPDTCAGLAGFFGVEPGTVYRRLEEMEQKRGGH